MNIHEKLNAIQTSLKAPKSNYNSFGKYGYRTCEQILEAAKPKLHETKSNIILTDEPVLVGDRFYIKATAKLMDTEKPGEFVEATAYAREPATKKGMDEAQVTGAASSYARKYALAGLFALDGAEDPDATNKHEDTQKKPTARKTNVNVIPESQVNKLVQMAESKGIKKKQVENVCLKDYGKTLYTLDMASYNQLYKRINDAEGARA